MSVRRWSIWLFMILLSCMCAITAWAQDVGLPLVLLNSEYIKEWLVLVPFF